MERGTREYALWSIAIALVLIFALVPVVWIMALSLKTPASVADGRFLPAHWTLDNYKGLFDGGISNSPFLKPLINSIVIALISTVIAIALAASAAYAIARLDFPGKGLILGVALAIAIFPTISIVGPLFDIWRSIGLFDTYPGLIIPYLTFALPLSIYILVAFFREIPWDLQDAAAVDGATPFQSFRKVILPLAAPGTFTAAILVFIFCWNEFLFAITLTSSKQRADGTRRAGVLYRRVAVHRADREHRRSRRGRDRPDHPLRPAFPAPNRRRLDRGRREGIKEALKWPKSCWNT